MQVNDKKWKETKKELEEIKKRFVDKRLLKQMTYLLLKLMELEEEGRCDTLY